MRRALYRAVTWFDLPDVRDAVSQALASEDARTRETLEYLLWRLAGLTEKHATAPEQARAFVPGPARVPGAHAHAQTLSYQPYAQGKSNLWPLALLLVLALTVLAAWMLSD